MPHVPSEYNNCDKLVEHSRATIQYGTHIINELTAICNNIDLLYQNPLIQNKVYIKIMVFITRETDRYFTQMLHPPVAGAATVQLPRYNEISEFIQVGRIRDLTAIPTDMFTPVEEQANLTRARSTSGNRDRDSGGQGGRGGGNSEHQNLECSLTPLQYRYHGTNCCGKSEATSS